MKKPPLEFYTRLDQIYNKKDLEIIFEGYNSLFRKVSFRVNHLKSDSLEIENELLKNNIKFEKLSFLNDSYLLSQGRERLLWDLDIYKEGKIYLQSISSQIPVAIMGLEENKKVLDVTSAPGSKTSQIADIMNNSGAIIANELNAIRIEKLKHTLGKLGVKNTSIIKNDARKLNQVLENDKFDYILADLPCSAEGRINYNKEKSFGFWKQKVIDNNSNLQKEILESVIPLLNNNGVLVYSTCTLAPEENEEVVEFILDKFIDLELVGFDIDFEYSRDGIKEFNQKKYSFDTSKVKRFLPSIETEGFFVAKFIKK